MNARRFNPDATLAEPGTHRFAARIGPPYIPRMRHAPAPGRPQVTGDDTAPSAPRTGALYVGVISSLVALGLFALFPDRLFLPDSIGPDATQQDYWMSYGGARAGWSDVPANPYDPQSFEEFVGAPNTLLWLYPPTMLVLLAPFGALSYGASKVIWVSVALLSAGLLARIASGSWRLTGLVVVSPLTWTALFIGRFDTLFALWLLAGLWFSRRRPWLAAVCIALLTVKPQYGLLVIPFLLAVGALEALRRAFALSVVLAGASAALFGLEVWGWFFSSAASGAHRAFMGDHGHSGRITLVDAVAGSGLTLPPTWMLQTAAVLLAVAGILGTRRSASAELRVAFAMAATACAAPYLFVYDYLILYGAIIIVVMSVPGLRGWQWTVLALIWLAPPLALLWPSPIVPSLLWPLNALGAAIAYTCAREYGAVGATIDPADVT